MTQKRKRDTPAVSSSASSASSALSPAANKNDKKTKHSSSSNSSSSNSILDTSKPTAVFQPNGPRTHTLSIALPGSIIANAKSHDQKTFLCGTIARALAVFCVDEVVIFNDLGETTTASAAATTTTTAAAAATATASNGDNKVNDETSYTGYSNPSHFMAHVLSYLETPPYLRKKLFPMHPNLRTAGTLPSLDLPSHVRGKEWCRYREGVVVGSDSNSNDNDVEVDIGLPDRHIIKGAPNIPANTRVTVRLDGDDTGHNKSTNSAVVVTAVSPTTPREQDGYYWGYNVRVCSSLSTVLTECPFDGGYDVSFGTSERGKPVDQILSSAAAAAAAAASSSPPQYRHLLIVFGGVAGLETAAANDADLVDRGITGRNISDLFDYWVNLVPGQGSRTIRTEEAVWLGLMGLRRVVVGQTE